jgi:multiple antibiotic resistance protein
MRTTLEFAVSSIVMLLVTIGPVDLVKVVIFFVVLLLALAVTFTALVLADVLSRVLGVTDTNVVARISGLLLAALAVQFIFDGIGASHLLR